MRINKKEFIKFLDEVGFTKEVNQLVKAVRTNEEKILFLESRIARLEDQDK